LEKAFHLHEDVVALFLGSSMNAVLVAALLGAAMTAIAVTIFFLTVCLRPNHRPGAVKVMSRRQGGNGENHEA
jgi:hypothetical protein